VLLLFALERLANAAMVSSPVGARVAWMLSAVFGSTGAALLGLSIVMRGVGRGSHRSKS
jgi:hypothetical protein